MSFILFNHYYRDDLSGFRSALEGAITNGTHAIPSRRGGLNKQSTYLTAKDVNRTDEYGRTVLHLACSENKIQFVRALLEFPGIDVLIADYESGWTPLHRALYAGNLAIGQLIISFLRDTIRIKDREGYSPFDVLNSTLKGTNPLPLNPDEGGSELFTFGSNANNTLGFTDGDDRTNPERIILERTFEDTNPPANERFLPIRIRDVQMSKLHTVVLTTDPTNNFYICGFGNNGRLGLDSNQTQFTFKNLPKFGSVQVVQVAVGQDHTLALTADGSCYTWGSNKFGQLGYSTEGRKSKDEQFQPSPRKVIAGIKKEHVVGVAVSRIHSVAFTNSDLFMWGKNTGQLGFSVEDGQDIELIPRMVVSLPHPVVMVAATDSATACLLENGDVIVYMNGGHFKVHFPFEIIAGDFAMFRPRAIFRKNSIIKIVAGDSSIYALGLLGDIYSFRLDQKQFRTSKASALTRLVKPQKIWSLRRNHLAARDIDAGQDGSIILCTASGSVWIRNKRLARKDSHGRMSEFKFRRIPFLTRVVSVRGNLFGAYAAIRSDSIPPLIEIDNIKLSDSLEELLSFSGESEVELSDIESLSSQSSTESGGNHLPHTFQSTLKLLQDEELIDILGIYFRDLATANEGNYDLYLSSYENEDLLIPVHRIIIGSRSEVLMQILSSFGPESSNMPIECCSVGDKRILRFNKVGIISLLLLVYFSYTDHVLPVWDGFAKSKLPKRFSSAKEDLIRLSSLLKISALSTAIYISNRSALSLSHDFYKATQDHRSEKWGDLIVQLKHGKALRCHSAILACRSEFFSALIAARWSSVPQPSFDNCEFPESQNALGDKSVDMKHVRLSIFKIVLDFIYGKEDLMLFSTVHAESLLDFLDFLVEVMAVATELLIPKLAQLCQSVIREYVNMQTAGSLLEEADFYSADGLRSSLMQYIITNLEGMLENRLLQLDQSLWSKLEEATRCNQVEKLPLSKSGLLLTLLEDRHPGLVEKRKRERDLRLEEFTTGSLPRSFSSSYGSAPKSFPKSFINLNKNKNLEESQRLSRLAKDAVSSVQSQMSSPAFTPCNTESDFIFDMEEEGMSLDSRQSPSEKNTIPSVDDFGKLDRQMYSQQRTYSTTDNEELLSSSITSVTSESRSNTPVIISHGMNSVSSRNGAAWASITSKGSAIDFKDILSQSKSRPKVSPSSTVSGISLGLQKKNLNASNTPSKTIDKLTHQSAFGDLSRSPQAENIPVLSIYQVPVVEEHVKLSQKDRKKQRQIETSAVQKSETGKAAINFSPWQKGAHSTPSPAHRSISLGGVDSNISSYHPGPQTSFASAVSQSLTCTPVSVKTTSSVTVTPGLASSSTVTTPSSNSSSVGAPTYVSTPTRKKASNLYPSPSSFKLGASTSALSPGSGAQFSLAEIIEQEQIEKERAIARATQKKSIVEIQEEEAFEAWWKAESERVQADIRRQEQSNKSATAQAPMENSKKKAGARYKNHSKGRGGSSRGRNSSGGSDRQGIITVKDR
ncbi:uncharacterized protein V1516DRAFT_664243 [Lipomyces oligophaga]|uniref:uncharacterized protein n=1 Tax=Lipomyces oligophaga TaxID=45792 RepID=UPI0034CDB657